METVRLRASGRPTTQGVVPVTFATPFSTCSFSVNVGGLAVYTIDCSSVTLSGSYTDGVRLDASNYITLQVMVTMPGNFKLTATTRGMTFSDSGSLAAGLQTIVLKGTGLPSTWGTYDVVIGLNGCVVPIVVQPTSSSRVWRFTAGGILYEGPTHSVATVLGGAMYTLTISGSSQTPVAGQSFTLQLKKIYTGSQTNVLGTYMSSWTVAQGQASLRLGDVTTGFLADSTHGNLTVNRLTLIGGTFLGTAVDASGNSTPLTNGYFRF